MGNNPSSLADRDFDNDISKGQGRRETKISDEAAPEALSPQSEAAPTLTAVDDEPPTLDTSILEESDDDEDDDDSSSEEEEDDFEFQQALAERRRILEECKQLKTFADFFHHPEKPVVADATATARCFFNRPSAPERLSYEEAEEQATAMEDLAALKKLAIDYKHPELPVITTDPYACGRNYFDRYSAPEQETVEDMEEKAQVLAEAAALKRKATDFMHPELPVVTTDPFACGRNYFGRITAPEQETVDNMEEKAQILAEAAALKKLAVDYHHPEMPVVTTDPFACGRNYFTRPSAPSFEDSEDAEERERILADCQTLKSKAVDFLHPELPVITTDPFACGRNYFTRYSAPQREEGMDADRAAILADCQALKSKAVDFLHPELPVTTTDPFACGRNYFTRYSAPEQMDPEEADERALILEEASLLKELATHYLHPELPVVTTDQAAKGRNYFSRYNAQGHAHMVHTFPAHEHDDHHEEHHEHVEHWGMDEDAMFDDMRQQMRQVIPTQNKVAAGDEEAESNLSRSPSSVMLYTGESIYD